MGQCQLIWRVKARKLLIEHLHYAQEEFGQLTVTRWLESIQRMEYQLQHYPQSYTLIPQLGNGQKEYRGFTVMRNFKVIYSYDERRNRVVIETIWDMRMNPNKLTISI